MTQVYYTKTYATPSYYTEVPKYYTEKADYCATAYAVKVYYTEKPKCYSAATNTKQRLRFITPPRPLSITLQLTLPPATTLKFQSITLPRVTKPLRHLNVTPRPTLLHLSKGRLLNIS
jgi:hypothetical protein